MADQPLNIAPLHIAIDARELGGRPTGVGRYLDRVLHAWLDDASFPHRLTLFAAADPPSSIRALGSRLTWQTIADARAGTMWEQTRLPRAVTASGADVLFAAGYTAPMRLPCPFVVAIYDVSFFAHPEWFGAREGFRRRWLTKRAARNASSIVTISEFSASEIVRFLGVARGRIALAPPGAPEIVAPVSPSPRAPIVLFVGSLFNRRRIPELLRAFAFARQRVPAARLILVGDNRTRPHVDPRTLATELGIGDAVEWRDYVSDAELAALYASARVFAFLSDYEGFGMTPMEAIAHGVPAVLQDTAVAREIYGDGTRLVAPVPDVVASSLAELLTDDRAHAELVKAGQRRLAQFTWTRAATTIRRALESAAASSAR